MTNKKISKLLDIKEKQKEELERQLKVEKGELRQRKEELKGLKSDFNALKDAITNEVLSSNVELYFQYLHILGKKIDSKEKEVEKKKEDVNKKEEQLLFSHRETKALNILKDEIIKEELKKTILNEQKNFDFDYLTRKFKK